MRAPVSMKGIFWPASATILGLWAIYLEKSMNEQIKKDEKKIGIEVDSVTFDSNGEVVGLDDSVLDNVAGGLMDSDSGCINGANCK
jgi:hypothetical protein